jgi:hypothetical protein
LAWKSGIATATDPTSIATFGKLSQSIDTTLEKSIDASAQATRYLKLRAFPRAKFDAITFPVTSPEIDDSTRDALLSVFMGLPIRITELPLNIASGQFEGYVEGWTWSIGRNSMYLTLNVSPIEFSQVAIEWEQVNASESWNTITNTLTWEKAIGAVA